MYTCTSETVGVVFARRLLVHHETNAAAIWFARAASRTISVSLTANVISALNPWLYWKIICTRHVCGMTTEDPIALYPSYAAGRHGTRRHVRDSVSTYHVRTCRGAPAAGPIESCPCGASTWRTQPGGRPIAV